MIIHIIKKETYRKALEDGKYVPDSYKADGFIHCCNIEQVIKVANINYKGERNLCLLYIDETKVLGKVIYEDLYDLHENYPHIYGALNMDSVIKVKDFIEKNGTFILPK